jgi:hypothetical protein
MYESPFAMDKKPPPLNESQKRSLSVSLQLLEEELFIIQLLAGNERHDGQLFSPDVDLNEIQQRALEKLIRNVLSYIHDLRQQFDLEVKTKRLSSRVMSTSGYFWAVLCDQKSNKLTRYGAVFQGLSDMLDPVLDQILEALRKMVAVIEDDGG